ncbi:type II CAAX prenyl endopeptidase Rce1 family protein [uncultured Kocuria sp.]|uniref:CPBP family glutamic-type intramembrane protease n=1 Tax=uncultured Kocuria sp. TaxID=259305 RepID=UPI00259966DB|nr:CPBP family glutamic-type intramembrane protease [uncultured Kocuria sp.]
MRHRVAQLRTALFRRDILNSDYFLLRDTSSWAWKAGHLLGATIVILLSYAWFFSGGVAAAFDTISGHSKPISGTTDDAHWDNAAVLLGQVLVALVVLAAVFFWIRPRFELTPMSVRVHRAGWVAFVYTLGLMLFSWSVPIVNGWFEQHHAFPRGPDHSPAAVVDAMASSILAGVSEEIVITVIPILLLRAVDIPWKFIVTLLLLERILFHVYYGPGAVSVLVWASLSILLYRYTQSALGLVLAHALYDIYCDASIYLGDNPAIVVLMAGFLIYALLILAGHIGIKSRQPTTELRETRSVW